MSPDEDSDDGIGVPTDDEPSDSGGEEGATRAPAGRKYCHACGVELSADANFCSECGTAQNSTTTSQSPKDRVSAGVLAILLGGLGAHHFYLGNVGIGVLYLCFFWTGIPAIVGLIEGIIYLSKTDAEFQREYVEDEDDSQDETTAGDAVDGAEAPGDVAGADASGDVAGADASGDVEIESEWDDVGHDAGESEADDWSEREYGVGTDDEREPERERDDGGWE